MIGPAQTTLPPSPGSTIPTDPTLNMIYPLGSAGAATRRFVSKLDNQSGGHGQDADPEVGGVTRRLQVGSGRRRGEAVPERKDRLITLPTSLIVGADSGTRARHSGDPHAHM
jgi:hypothetical protein